MLRKFRVILAVTVISALTAFFLDFSETVPRTFSWLAKIQFLPALMSTLNGLAISFVLCTSLILLTAFFGRFYCSCVCPLGILQDVISRIVHLFRPKKKRKFYQYRKPWTRTRYIILAVAAVALMLSCFGFGRSLLILGVLDPYSDFGRIVTQIFYPFYAWGNNLLVPAARFFGYFGIYLVTTHISNDGITLIVALVSLIAITFLAAKYGRLYCNAICPVGTLLGIISRRSLFRVRIDRERCAGCRLCETQCKGSCIDIEHQRIDNSRCVVCLNCLDVCKKNALHYTCSTMNARNKAVSSHKNQAVPSVVADLSKRRFLAGATALFLVGNLFQRLSKASAQETSSKKLGETVGELPVSYNGNVSYKVENAISPPGAISLDHLMARCTSCHLCVAKCPGHVIKPAFLEYGLAGIMIPVMKFSTEVFCNYDCTLCGEVCPTGAIKPLTLDDKHLTQIGHVVFIKENCVVFNEETNCGACAEHCPTQAVRMVEYKGTLSIPETHEEYCVGCGACESICPVLPFKAIHVEGNRTHKNAVPPPLEKQVEIKMDDFGF